MEPTLRAGDWLLVDPDAFRGMQPRIGDLVVARDPRKLTRLLVKRVADIRPDGFLLTGDHPAHDTDGSEIGVVSSSALVGRPWLRYWPARRVGPVR
jgi:nickel-type superoxide dismutase maturation protease